MEWVGDLERIRETLLAEGWTKPPARDLISTIHRVADVSSLQYLPLVSPQYLDHKPFLILTRQENKKPMLVLRLWESNLNIKGSNPNVWVGIVDFVPRSYMSFGYLKRRIMQMEISPRSYFFCKKEKHHSGNGN